MSLSHLPTFHRFLPPKPPASHRRNHHRNHLNQLIFSPTPLFLPLRSTTTKITASSTKTLPQSAIRRIADKLRSLGFVEDPPGTASTSAATSPPETLANGLQIGEIFVPNSKLMPKYRVGHTLDSSWSTPENPVPEPGTGGAISKLNELIGEAKRERMESARETVPTLAELTLPAKELRRLITVGIRMKQKLTIGKAGVTEGVVNGIHERWRGEEVVKLVCDDVWKLNMKRTHHLLESKTGGMVVWRAGSKIILYRGPNYKFPYFNLKEGCAGSDSENTIMEDGSSQSGDETDSSNKDATESVRPSENRSLAQSSLVQGVGTPNRVRFQLPGEKLMLEEADRLLDGLGPRFTDWWGYDPLPVDADLLPAVVPGLRRPFRLLPYGVKPQLTNDEMTVLKRLGRPLPCHFALGRNRNLQGLAAAMIKLWEKCEIAKIAVKRGVQNTNSDMMATELKRLTGGLLLSRDKEFIVFYRGKDFLPSSVSSAIEERRRVKMQRDQEQPKADSASIVPEHSNYESTSSVLSGENEAINEPKESIDSIGKTKNNEAAFERTRRKLSMALEKKERAEKLLAELEQREITQQSEIDKEGITEEERYMLRKVGLKMRPFLLLGRRGVFDGTVENMHLHWKYRELVKIICGERNIEEVHKVAQTLEAESGGILVAVEIVRNGYAIIIYRGKNYQRPARLRPETLLNKKEAMRRSLEAQRRQSLKLHVLKLSKNVEELLLVLEKDRKRCDTLSNYPMNSDSEMEQQNQIEPVDFGSHVSGIESVKSSVFLPTHEVEPTVLEKSDDNHENVASKNVWESDDESADRGPVSLYKKAPHSDYGSHDSGIESVKSSVFLPTHEVELTVLEKSEDNYENVASKNVWESDDESADRGPVTLYKKAPHSDYGSHASGIESVKSSVFLPTHEVELSVLEKSEDRHENVAPKNVWQSDDESADEGPVSSYKKAPHSYYESSKIPAAPLSNKERLILRKHALKMTRCPLLALGKSNILTGVAKAIKDHFKKYPFVIVNVKGRAKGTSVQELIFKLQRATGALLVSQEPSKIILYRGWGVKLGISSAETLKDKGTQPTVSPELLAAMRIECGLSSNPK